MSDKKPTWEEIFEYERQLQLEIVTETPQAPEPPPFPTDLKGFLWNPKRETPQA